LDDIVDNLALIDAGGFDIGIIASSTQSVYFRGGIHIWIRSADYDNANLMILLSYIILAHPSWKKSDIHIFQVYRQDQFESFKKTHEKLLQNGRLPITENNIEWVLEEPGVSFKSMVNYRSKNAGLTMIGFHIEQVKHEGAEVFNGYDETGQILFVHSNRNIEIN
jgi:hypothetical protein